MGWGAPAVWSGRQAEVRGGAVPWAREEQWYRHGALRSQVGEKACSPEENQGVTDGREHVQASAAPQHGQPEDSGPPEGFKQVTARSGSHCRKTNFSKGRGKLETGKAGCWNSEKPPESSVRDDEE